MRHSSEDFLARVSRTWRVLLISTVTIASFPLLRFLLRPRVSIVETGSSWLSFLFGEGSSTGGGGVLQQNSRVSDK